MQSGNTPRSVFGTQTWNLVTLDDLRYALDYAAAADMFDQAMLPELSVSDRLF